MTLISANIKSSIYYVAILGKELNLSIIWILIMLIICNNK